MNDPALVGGDNPVEHLQKAIAQSPQDSRLYVDLATELIRTQEHQQALDVLDKVLKFDPNYPSALYLKATTALTLGRLIDAFEAIAKALQIDPNNERYQAVFKEITSKMKSMGNRPRSGSLKHGHSLFLVEKNHMENIEFNALFYRKKSFRVPSNWCDRNLRSLEGTKSMRCLVS